MFLKQVKVMGVLLATLLLTSCAGTQEVSTVQRSYVPVRTVVPTTLTVPCKISTLKGNTVGDLVRHIVELRGSIDECSNRMSTIDKSVDGYDSKYGYSTDRDTDSDRGGSTK